MSSSFVPRRSPRLAALRQRAAPSPAAVAKWDAELAAVSFPHDRTRTTIATALWKIFYNYNKEHNETLAVPAAISYITYMIANGACATCLYYTEIGRMISALEASTNFAYASQGRALRKQFCALPNPHNKA